MAKYDVTHTCGHTVEIEQFGPEQARREARAQMRQHPCLACRNAEAAAANAEAGLPALTGSPKQIAWAESIRAKAVANRTTTPEQQRIAGAAWWIDHRSQLSPR